MPQDLDRSTGTAIRSDPGPSLPCFSCSKSCSNALRWRLEKPSDRQWGFCLRTLLLIVLVRAINPRNSGARIGLDRRANLFHLFVAATPNNLRLFADSTAPGGSLAVHFCRRPLVSLFRTALLELKSKTMAQRTSCDRVIRFLPMRRLSVLMCIALFWSLAANGALL